jgi:hypothetical protein
MTGKSETSCAYLKYRCEEALLDLLKAYLNLKYFLVLISSDDGMMVILI